MDRHAQHEIIYKKSKTQVLEQFLKYGYNYIAKQNKRFLYICTYSQFIERSLAGCTPDRLMVDYLWDVKTGGVFWFTLYIFEIKNIFIYYVFMKNTANGT